MNNSEKKKILPDRIKLLIDNLNCLKKNFEEIVKLVQSYKELSDFIKQIELIVKELKGGIKQTDEDFLKIEDLTKNLQIYLNNEKEIDKLIEITKFINDSKDILDYIIINPDEANNEINIIENSTSGSTLFDGFTISSERLGELQQMCSYINNEPKDETSNQVNNNNDLNEKKNKFKQDFHKFIKVLLTKFDILYKDNNLQELPQLKDSDDINNFENLIDFLTFICTSSSVNVDNENNTERTEKTERELKDIFISLFSNDQTEDDINFLDEHYVEEVCIQNNFDFDNIKSNLIFFINIISKEKKKLNNDDLKNISNKIIEKLVINDNDLFLIQNSPIDNFVKTFNLEDIYFQPNEISPTLTKFYELKTLKTKLLIHDYIIDKKCFDNNGNFIYPNTRRNFFRGKEHYYPPYKWMGIGLNVSGKYDNGNDDWLDDISQKSEWAIAYRGIRTAKNSKIKIENYLKYFIEKRDLTIAITNKGENLNDKRRWKATPVGKGIWMTPYISIAEKYTQAISFDNKKYKILLMAKVKINKIREPKGNNYWVLNNEDIRIYRVLFKEINN